MSTVRLFFRPRWAAVFLFLSVLIWSCSSLGGTPDSTPNQGTVIAKVARENREYRIQAVHVFWKTGAIGVNAGAVLAEDGSLILPHPQEGNYSVEIVDILKTNRFLWFTTDQLIRYHLPAARQIVFAIRNNEDNYVGGLSLKVESETVLGEEFSLVRTLP